MEFLVHNISHSDLIVELTWLRDDDDIDVSAANTEQHSNSNNNGSHVERPTRHGTVTLDGVDVPLSLLGRPKFSLFQQTSQMIMDTVEELLRTAPASATHLSSACEDVSSAPADSTNRHADATVGSTHPQQRNGGDPADLKRIKTAHAFDTQAPVGFKLDKQPIPIASLHDFQIRGGSESFELIAQHWTRNVAITAVYFPLVALLLPKWRAVLTEFKSERSHQLLYLISGAGVPHNASHSHVGNSTEATARLLQLFVAQYYCDIAVHLVHSGSNIFRFDDNVQFMNRTLRPRLEAHRDVLVEKRGDAWKAHFHVTIAYTDGPPARLSALNASLRIYRPSYLHVWQRKAFWHERRLRLRDVDFHAFENIEASPCVAIREIDDRLVQTLVGEMQTFRDQFLHAERASEIPTFWLRKSRKPVLAVLIIEKRNALTGQLQVVVHRGMNCEVSMPTGSLCAERNAIGSALASDPTLHRRQMKLIGVLGLNLGSPTVVTAAQTTTTTTTEKVGANEAKPSIETTSTTTTTVAAVELDSDADVVSVAPVAVDASPSSVSIVTVPPSLSNTDNSNSEESLRKPKRPRTFSCDDTTLALAQTAAAAAATQTAGDSSSSDRNPLAPCGACNEWLVKIAEANPSFRVVTFENARCRSVYINQIM